MSMGGWIVEATAHRNDNPFHDYRYPKRKTKFYCSRSRILSCFWPQRQAVLPSVWTNSRQVYSEIVATGNREGEVEKRRFDGCGNSPPQTKVGQPDGYLVSCVSKPSARVEDLPLRVNYTSFYIYTYIYTWNTGLWS